MIQLERQAKTNPFWHVKLFENCGIDFRNCSSGLSEGRLFRWSPGR